jgi:mRNA interferase MazF
VVYNPFDIVKVPFPFTDQYAVKHRPALVISSEQYQVNYGHCILMMITSAKQSTWIDDIEIENLSMTGLTYPSKIRFKIFSLESLLISSKLGTLDSDLVKTVKHNLQKYIALN